MKHTIIFSMILYSILASTTLTHAADIFRGIMIRNQTHYPIEVTLASKGLRNTVQAQFIVRIESYAENMFAPNIVPTFVTSTPIEVQRIDALLPKNKKITYQVNAPFMYAYQSTGPCAILTVDLRDNAYLSYTYRVGCEYSDAAGN